MARLSEAQRRLCARCEREMPKRAWRCECATCRKSQDMIKRTHEQWYATFVTGAGRPALERALDR